MKFFHKFQDPIVPFMIDHCHKSIFSDLITSSPLIKLNWDQEGGSGSFSKRDEVWTLVVGAFNYWADLEEIYWKQKSRSYVSMSR